MQDRICLLSIAEFLDEEQGEALMQEAVELVDESRKRKFLSIKQGKAKAACLGAGLLLQTAVQEALLETAQGGKAYIEYPNEVFDECIKLSVLDILNRVHSVLSLEFVYGACGKPYLKDYPFYFNLSHSGEYVVCAISENEIGIDIQEHRTKVPMRIAERYFSKAENCLLQKCSQENYVETFYDLWAKKEAYGKYTGDGISKSLKLDFSEEDEVGKADLGVRFRVHRAVSGYTLAVCKGYEKGMVLS